MQIGFCGDNALYQARLKFRISVFFNIQRTEYGFRSLMLIFCCRRNTTGSSLRSAASATTPTNSSRSIMGSKGEGELELLQRKVNKRMLAAFSFVDLTQKEKTGQTDLKQDIGVRHKGL